MTSLLKPFSGFVPAAEYAPRLVGPPTSMLSRGQKNASRDDELSFRHVVGRGASAAHSEAMNWLRRCIELDALVPVESAVIVHRLTHGNFSATGFIADVSLAAYDNGRIRRHEATVAKTQRKMFEYMRSTRIFGNPVALAHRDHREVAASLGQHSERTADVEFEAIDGAHHSLWIVGGDEAQTLCDSFSDVLYITDGHHRLAAASSLAIAEGRTSHLPAAFFAEKELTLAAFARAIHDDDVDAGSVLTSLTERFQLEEVQARVPRPTNPHQVGVRIAGRSFLLTIPAAVLPTDVYERLDVNLLQDLVLEPLFRVTNPRTDSRLRFMADVAHHDHDVDSCTAWFLPYPTSVPEVMSVADTGRTLPPKSTYFMPKVPSGLVIRSVDVD